MENFRGYTIEILENNEKEYPYKAIARKGNEVIKHKGHSIEEAVDLVKESINILISKVK